MSPGRHCRWTTSRRLFDLHYAYPKHDQYFPPSQVYKGLWPWRSCWQDFDMNETHRNERWIKVLRIEQIKTEHWLAHFVATMDGRGVQSGSPKERWEQTVRNQQIEKNTCKSFHAARRYGFPVSLAVHGAQLRAEDPTRGPRGHNGPVSRQHRSLNRTLPTTYSAC